MCAYYVHVFIIRGCKRLACRREAIKMHSSRPTFLISGNVYVFLRIWTMFSWISCLLLVKLIHPERKKYFKIFFG